MYRHGLNVLKNYLKVQATLLQTTERRYIKRWVAPTLRELQRRRDKLGSPKLEHRSSYLEWNYDAEIYAFGKRLGEEFKEDILYRALTHRSYARDLEDKDGAVIDDNTNLIKEGYNIIARYLTEEFKKKYPDVLAKVLYDHLMTIEMLAYVASHIGLKDIILCRDFPVEDAILANSFAAIVAALAVSSGQERAEKFVKDFIIAQLNGKDVYDIWKIDDPFSYLQNMFKDKEVEPRLCNHSGVNTILANYQVGLYSNKELLGIGFGESIDVAKQTAALDALRRIYNKYSTQN